MSVKIYYTIIDLLPYKPDVLLTESFLVKRLLKLVNYLFIETVKTIDDLTKTVNTINYDPHVGENLCQIRAVYLLELLSGDNAYLNKRLELTKTQIAACLDTLTNKQLVEPSEKQTIQALFEELELIFPIPRDLYTLVLMRFLTNFRICNTFDNMIIDYDRMKQDLDISKNLSRRFIHHYQKELSMLSCDFIVSNSSLLGSKFSNILALVSHTDEDARSTLPCYLVMKVLMSYLLLNKINILVVVKNILTNKFISLFYTFNRQQRCHQLVPNPTLKMKREHCFVLHGISSYRSSEAEKYDDAFECNGLSNIIMSNMATHPQYSGKKLQGIKQNPFLPLNTCSDRTVTNYANELEEEFLRMKALGERIGCTESNPSLFFIRHIFVDTLLNQLHQLKQQKFYSDQIHDQIVQAA